MDQYLIQILKETNTIIIPDLGALTITSEEQNEIMLMPFLKHDDGKLANHIAEKEGIDGVEAKIAEDGEILAKGPNIMMGYYKQPELTAEVMTGEWFHTGDIGVIEDGFIRITDRKKEMFKTSGGKYVAPQLIENELKASHLIEQSMVIGSGRKFPSAICILNEPGVKEWCSRHDITYTTIEEMADNQQVRDRVWQDVERANAGFGKWEQVKKIIIDTDEFTVGNGCLTPTFKVKRKPILAKYEAKIEALYAE